MPTLHWIGKEKVLNHHLDVPFHILETIEGPQPQESTEGGHVHLIKGDNLLALKALIPKYEGKVKCIYIDPPYNTGNEGWVYNDAVNDPKIKRWLGQVVGKEADDLSRHDKWLCMMYPRLKLLSKLLRPDGAIFISLDDNEAHHLKIVLDEIFGAGNFIADIIWKKRDGAPNDRKVGYIHEHILVFGNGRENTAKKTYAEESFNLIPRSEKANNEYRVFKEPDGPDPKGPFRKIDTTANGKGGRYVESLFYGITNPYTKEEVWPRKGTCWRHNKDDMELLQSENRLYWGVNGESTTPMRKLYLYEARDGMTVPSIWSDIALNQHGARDIEMIFGEKAAFDTPKPVDLIEQILQIGTDNNSIVLDSFAGSGTTAHAVLNLNKKDGGNRQCILVEMEEYAESITAERVKRVIAGYGEGTKAVEGTGGRFQFSELGPKLFHEDGNLNAEVSLNEIRNYVWWSETRSALPIEAFIEGEGSYFLGLHQETAYYFYYEKEAATTLDEAFLNQIQHKADTYVVYADELMLSENRLRQLGIQFKKIPRDIHLS